MLQGMRELALDFLQQELRAQDPSNPEEWYYKLHENERSRLMPFLTESLDGMERVFVIRPCPDNDDLALLSVEELTKDNQASCPFVAQTGNVPQLGPLFKPNKGKTKVSPTPKIINRTVDVFRREASTEEPWSSYFQSVLDVLGRRRLSYQANISEVPKDCSLIELAILLMDEEAKSGVFLAIADEQGRLPGEVDEYHLYLQGILPGKNYETKEAPQVEGICSHCQKTGTVYSNALKGAGLNVLNVDRLGAFPGVSTKSAHKRYALCLACADLLYIYYRHVSSSFFARIAGEKALVIPELFGGHERRSSFALRFSRWLGSTEDGVVEKERRIVRFLSQEECMLNLRLVWAKFGQLLEDVDGMLIDVLPSRLQQLSATNHHALSWDHPIFPIQPRHPLAQMDLSMPILALLFRYRGPHAKNNNASRRVRMLKRDLIGALFHKRSGESLLQRCWDEWHRVMTSYLMEVFDHKKVKPTQRLAYLLHETKITDNTKEKTPISLASWVRHLAYLLHYLRNTGVFPMPQSFDFTPQLETLQPYFGEESGIDNYHKTFAFLLGVLFGKLLQVQTAREVNISSNALTWLKRFRLSGSDLPELYNKVRSRFLIYGTEANESVRSVAEELSSVGSKLGNHIELNTADTCYFLLLGQSLSTQILPAKKQK